MVKYASEQTMLYMASILFYLEDTKHCLPLEDIMVA